MICHTTGRSIISWRKEKQFHFTGSGSYDKRRGNRCGQSLISSARSTVSLEFIEDVLPELPKDREVTILDFGCSKSYLTFAIYYYLHELKGYDIRIIGLDLKTDVIYACNQLAKNMAIEN